MMTPLHHRVGSPLAHKDTVIGDGDDILEVIPDNCRGQEKQYKSPQQYVQGTL